MDSSHKRELNKGSGDALNRAVEIVATPMIFALLGWFLDSKVGTQPLFTLVFGILVFGYVMVKLFVRYGEDMRRHELRIGTTGSDHGA